MTKMCRFLFFLGALLGLSGCPDTPCFGGGSTVAPPSQGGVILVGEQVRLQVSPTLNSGCGLEAEARPATLTVEVYGPDNQLVESQATLGNPSSALATLKFTPDKPGRYHIFAAFDPIGGIHQFDLYAARDRSAEAIPYTLSKACNGLERTKRGGWLCDSEFVRDGTVVRRFSGNRVAVAGDVVWDVGTSQVQRFVDTGTSLELTGTVSVSASPADFLLASETELLALRGPTLDRILFDGTALAVKGRAQLSSPLGTIGTTGLRAFLLRNGDRLAVVTNAPSGGTSQPFNTFTNQVCAYRIEPERIVRTTDPCPTFTGNVVGYEPSVVWVGTPHPFGAGLVDLRRLEWTAATGIAEQASLPLGMNFEVLTLEFNMRNSVVPVIINPATGVNSRTRATIAVYAPEQRAILLELLDAEFTAPSASTHLMWNPPTTGLQNSKVRVRPTTP
ncbi:hypothetical protein [Hyalangium sp.]|uniref:hypothetical protein n=1 Tax=Hyalangium sp. TaxID=2028555 RepID=UPI002D754A5C|nr:hypothetical protein [Hyalangium sp.]HYI01562.1 hypothetical protein [Hyalangium sp.]